MDPASASLAPVNIQRMLKKNHQISEAQSYAKTIVSGSIVASWHERPRNTTSAAVTGKSTQQQQQQEAQLERQQHKQQRQLRLKQLLDSERLALEAELRQRGLALTKHRD